MCVTLVLSRYAPICRNGVFVEVVRCKVYFFCRRVEMTSREHKRISL